MDELYPDESEIVVLSPLLLVPGSSSRRVRTLASIPNHPSPESPFRCPSSRVPNGELTGVGEGSPTPVKGLRITGPLLAEVGETDGLPGGSDLPETAVVDLPVDVSPHHLGVHPTRGRRWSTR